MTVSAIKPIERVPPNSMEGERAILGAILLNNEALVHTMELIVPDDFYRTGHRHIYESILKLEGRGAPADLVTLVEELKSEGVLDKVGGPAYIAELTNEVPSVSHARHYAEIVQKLSILRKMIDVSTEIASSGYSASSNVKEFLEEAEKLVFGVTERQIKKSFTSVKDALLVAFEKIEELHDKKDTVTGVPSGFYDLDDMTAGLQASDLIIVAGRPGMGKTSFMLNIAQYAATKCNIPIAFFSLEMSTEQLVMRMLTAEAQVDSQRLRRGMLRESDWPKLSRGAGTLSESPIFIDDTPGISTMELRAKARRLYSKHNIGMIVVDYLQLMNASGKNDNREQEISEISRSLKGLAKELNIPVVALSQLNRSVEQRPNKRPMISDLRESGAIEQDADVIMFIYREEVYARANKAKDDTVEIPEEILGKAEIIIGKQRHGPTGDIELGFDGKYTKFENLERRYD